MKILVIAIGIIILLFIWWNLWVSVNIVKYLKDKGEDASLFNNKIFIKGKIFKYLPVYKRLSLEEYGKTGPLYYTFYLSLVLSFIFLLIGLIIVS